jgi:hypothetical protein
MRKIFALLLMLGALASAAFAHGGKSHQLMGTVKALHENQLTITTTDGREASVLLDADTKYEKDKAAANRSALVAGVRVSVQLDEDDKTAIKIKIGGGGHQH